VVQNVLCRERICISSFADASQVLIPMEGILHVQMKNKHSCLEQAPYGRDSASSLAALSPYGRKNENHIERFHGSTSIVPQEALQFTTPSSMFSSADQPSLRIRRPRCSSARATGTSVAPTADSKRNAMLSYPSANFFCCHSARPFPFMLDFDLRETFFRRPHSRVLFFGRLQYRPS